MMASANVTRVRTLSAKISRLIVTLAVGVFLAFAYQNCGPAFEVEKLDALQSLATGGASALNGKTLYENNCAVCHGVLSSSNKLNRSSSQIRQAISSIPLMSTLKSLTADEVDSIALALNPTRPSDPLANPFVCDPGSDPASATLRKLTRREYVNTLMDLFAGQLNANDIQTELGYLPTESLEARPAVKLFESMNPTPTNLQLITAYNNIAGRIADVITASATKMSAVGGNACVSQTSVNDVCLANFINSFGLRAYRRPLTSEERTLYSTLYRTGASSADSMARVIEAMLQSPQFLYLIETEGSSLNGRSDLFLLSGYEIASRLSYMILGSMPDAALLDAAASGTLNSPAGVQQQVERLFGLAKAKDNIRQFYSQWLRIDRMPTMIVSSAFANGLDPAQFRAEARQEIIDFMDHLIWTQKTGYQGLLTSDLVFAKGPSLSKVYGVTASTQPQKITDPNRRGILTRAGMLSMSEIGTQDPIKRGVRVRVHLLCDTLGAPPNNADNDAAEVDPLSSTREQFATKTSPGQCMLCHASINPLGFAFGHFDAFGRYISQETVAYNGQSRVHSIDSRVAPAITYTDEPVIDGAVELQSRIAANNKGPACAVQQWMQFNVGRQVQGGDSCALATMYDALNRPGGTMLDMFKSLSGTNSFRTKKIAK